MTYSQTTAQALLEIKAVGFKFAEPIVFKSGIKSPVYVDNRRFPFFSEQWTQVIKSLGQLVADKKLDFDLIAGIETAGIPHSAALGFYLKKPSVFVRKQAKDHGTKKRVEGGEVKGKKVLLIEDHISTGGSSLSGVEALRAEGATVTDCLAITSYEFVEADQAFADAGVKLHTLTTFPVILETALKIKVINSQEKQVVESWLADPHGWSPTSL